ncbi:mechanosensitive ion channel protein 8-like isoform X1 [Juglans microcarpa x Juglans regia]|uniref:mechanosensitive ion channel protein 8-like isoform X1 n=1 Tax=Juglans microcarpa x Juglans regia TaxID=2249226 RepID=UPI001B7DBB3E|nr:mechanosensitive ion channel protein 8-like isoform X1 [Juglans microcarpa x Juglans regia]
MQHYYREERQPLLHHYQNHCRMAQREEVVVTFDDGIGCSNEPIDVSKNGRGSLSKNSQGSPETLVSPRSESVRGRNKDLSVEEEVLRCSSNAAFRRDPWRYVLSRKSRLIDLPEDPCQDSERGVNSDRVPGKDEDYEDDDIEDIPQEYKSLKFSSLTLLQLVSLILIIAALACSLWIPFLKRLKLWDLPLWKWEILVLALISGRLVSGWGIRVVVFLIENSFLLRKRVLYFVYGLRGSVQNSLWLSMVLLVWHSIFDDKVQEETKSKILPQVDNVLVCFLVGTLVWLLKTLLVKVLASTFHVNTFFERIREALFKQFVIETLSAPPSFRGHNTLEEAMAEVQELKKDRVTMPGELWATLLHRSVRSGELQNGPTVGKKYPFSSFSSKRRDEEIAVDHLHKLNQKTISAWNMGKMINIIRHGALSTLDEQIQSSNIEDEALLQITSECKAKEAAKRIFQNVVKPGSQYIYLDDLMRFMSQDKALETMRLFGVAAGKKGISKSSLKSWMVIAFRERRALALSLDDTKTAVDELRNMLNVLVAIIILIIWFIILGVPITHFLVFMSSQLLLVVFIFGNTCKTVFEAIVFLFIMHPFDVGDRCEVDGIQMIVDEMNILTTVFLRKDHQKIVYPNSILATKPIGNYQRSPHMVDTIDFCIHISTPLEKVSTMKERITRYIESKNEHWHPAPMVIVREVIDMNKLMMTVWATHQMNFQEMRERWSRRALLIEEMVKVFREVDIEYRMLPLDVNIRNMPPLISDRLPSNWTTCASRQRCLSFQKKKFLGSR